MRNLYSIFILFPLLAYSSEVDKIDIENHPQSSFPPINVTIGNKSVHYYGMDSSQAENIKFIKENEQLSGEVSLSGYIFAKEFIESFRLSNLASNKKEQSEFINIFNEKDPGKLVDFILSVNEKKRAAENNKEIKIAEKIINKKKSDELPSEIEIFPTGFIELKSPKENNERYFIKISDVTKEKMKLNNNKTKLNLLKAITIYSFQNVLTGLNFGDIENNSTDDILYKKLEALNLSLCGLNCSQNIINDLSKFAMNVGKIVNFEVVGNSKIENMEDFNKYIFAQQWCLLNNFSNACQSSQFSKDLSSISNNSIINELIKKHGSIEKMCQFLQK